MSNNIYIILLETSTRCAAMSRSIFFYKIFITAIQKTFIILWHTPLIQNISRPTSGLTRTEPIDQTYDVNVSLMT